MAHPLKTKRQNRIAMLTNYLKMSLRHLRKHKLFTFIKLTGLTVGFLGCLLIGLYLQHELSYDDCHEKADRIVRTTMDMYVEGESILVNVTGNKVGPTLRAEFPEVESAVRVIKYDNTPVRYADVLFEEKNFYYADSTFFRIFTFPLIAGDPQQALLNPNQIVLNQSSAKKYFGNTNPVGQSILVREKEYQVTGVMEDAPRNSQLKPQFVASFTSLRDAAPARETWWNANYATYFLLHQPSDREKLEAKIGPFMSKQSSETGMSGDDYLTFHFEPLRDVHLRSSIEGNFEPNGDIRYIYLLTTVGLLILLIGVTTYINLTTAASLDRSKEIGVQKVLGAGQWQLLQQHLGEAGVLTAIAVTASLAFTAPLLPLFNRLFDRSLSAEPLLQPTWLCSVLGLGLLITLLAGAYPAWAAAKFKPITTLKAGYTSSSKAAGGQWLRKSLIVFQFAISVFLLISTLILQGQMDFIHNKKLGYEKDHLVALPTDGKIIEKLGAFKSELTQDERVQGISLAYETPTRIQGGYSIGKSVTDDNGSPVTALPADEDFIKTMSMELAAGTSFDRNDIEAVRRMYKGDSTVVRSILLNEKQVAEFGWTPEEAVAKQVNFNGSVCQIKGVVKNFHFASLHEPVGNLVIFPDTWGNVLLVKLSGKDLPGTLSFLENKWQSLAPHRPFSYHFLDEEFDTMYGAEIQSTRLVTAGCGLAIFLACLGLLGLATYAIVQRTKEIGIRKVLGATTAGIVGLLSKDFLKLVVLALFLASPLAYFFMEKWLQDFTYRIDISWWVFVLAGIAAVGVAFLTVSFQSVKAALANPVKSLRSE